MFPNIDVTSRLTRQPGGRWEQYLTVREQLIPMEEFFAVQYISKELMKVFRDESQSGDYRTSQHNYLCNLLRAVEVRCLKTTDPCSAMQLSYVESASPQQSSNKFGSAFGLIADYEHGILIDIVNAIRNNQNDFAEILEQRVQSSLLELPSRDEILCNEWHTSKTAELYSPKIFENKKEDKGYWF